MALIYLAWIAGAKPMMWALIVALLLPVALWAGKRSVEHLFRQEPTAGSDEAPAVVPQPTAAVLLDRAVRFLLLVGGLGLLAWGWGIDYGALTDQDDPLARFARGALHAIIILLVADLLWQLASTAIDRQIASDRPAEATTRGRRRPPARGGTAPSAVCARCCRSCASSCSWCSP